MSEVRSNFKTITIGGTEYTITYYSSTISLEILTRIAKHVGEPLGRLFDGESKLGEDGLEAKLSEVLPGVLKSLSSNLDRKETVSLIKDIMDCLQVKTGDITAKVVFDEHFRGNIGQVFVVMMEVLKFQYGSLGNALGGVGGLTSMLSSLKQ